MRSIIKIAAMAAGAVAIAMTLSLAGCSSSDSGSGDKMRGGTYGTVPGSDTRAPSDDAPRVSESMAR